MACCRHGHEPSTSNLVRRFYLERHGSQLTLDLRSESFHCRSEDVDDGSCMVVELRMRLGLRFTMPSPEQGRSYLFEPARAPEARWEIPIYGDRAQHFSSLDATHDTLYLLLGAHLAPTSRASLFLYDMLSRFAGAAVAGAEIAGEQGPIRVLVHAEFLHMLSGRKYVDRHLDGRLRNMVRRVINAAESWTLGTCVVCLEEIQEERLRTVQLPCSHGFHLNCISPWLQRNNSCPLCRGMVPLVQDDDREQSRVLLSFLLN